MRPSRTTGTIVVEVVDQIGDGFAAEFSQVLAIDAVMKVIGGVGRLRGWDDQTGAVLLSVETVGIDQGDARGRL